MAKSNIPSINEVNKTLGKEKFLPVYFLFGEDDYAIDNTIEEIRKKVEPFIQSEFDKEFITLNRSSNIKQVLDIAYSFPFGSGKKLIVLKNFESLNNKKDFNNYILNPAEFTIVVCANYGKISDLNKDPYALLVNKKYIFEAKIEKGEDLVEWIVNKSKKINLEIDFNSARGLVEIVGEDKSLLDTQLEKIYNYSINNPKFSFEDIRRIISPTKQYTIFDLQDSLGARNKKKAIEIAYNLIDGNTEIVFIIGMLTKYFTTIAQTIELSKSNISDNEAAGMLKVSWYYYINCKKALHFMNDERLLKISNALLNADTAVKTSSMDSKTILSILIAEILE
ncbi:MAG: DNA polymerase III subunit delta [Ignavibacteria bacterium]|nr:DNA polymerase III subunit delta [Ignavibacteria bacterium]